MSCGYKRRIFWCACSLLANALGASTAAALDTKQSYALSHYLMAAVYERSGRPDAAIVEYKNALTGDPDSPLIHVDLAAAYIRNNMSEKAVAQLERAISLDPELVEPHAMLALLYSTQGQSQRATAEYEEALRKASLREPTNTAIYKNLGSLYLQQKKYPQAQKAYQLVVAIAPDDAPAHFYLADAYYELHEPEKTVVHLKKAIELNPEYADALNYLGYLYAQENRELSQAEGLIKKALALDPVNGAYLDSLGWVYFRRGQLKEAREVLYKAAQLLSDPVIFDHLGEVHLKLGEKEQAAANWQKSLELDATQESVREKIEQLKNATR